MKSLFLILKQQFSCERIETFQPELNLISVWKEFGKHRVILSSLLKYVKWTVFKAWYYLYSGNRLTPHLVRFMQVAGLTIRLTRGIAPKTDWDGSGRY